MTTIIDRDDPPGGPAPLEMPGPVDARPVARGARAADRGPRPPRRLPRRGLGLLRARWWTPFPKRANIHVDYDGKDLEVMAKAEARGLSRRLLDWFDRRRRRGIRDPLQGPGARRPGNEPRDRAGPRGGRVLLFLGREAAHDAASAAARDSRDIADYPNPDLAIEVDISRPQVDRAGIYAALRRRRGLAVRGRSAHHRAPHAPGTYEAVEASGFLPVRAEEVRRWVVEEDTSDDTAWARAAPGGDSQEATRR